MPLTIEEQVEIENSIWVVNTALKKQGQSKNEDLRQSAILYMCACRLRFNPDMNVKWTTFAYRNVYLFIKRTLLKDKTKQGYLIKTDYNDLSNLIPAEDKFDAIEGDDKYLQNLCNAEEQMIINYKKQGFNGREIAKKMNCSTSKVNCCLQKVRNKIREYQECQMEM